MSEAAGSFDTMSHEARRRRRRWRRLRRDLRELGAPSVDAGRDEVMPDFVLSRTGLSAIYTHADDLGT